MRTLKLSLAILSTLALALATAPENSFAANTVGSNYAGNTANHFDPTAPQLPSVIAFTASPAVKLPGTTVSTVTFNIVTGGAGTFYVRTGTGQYAAAQPTHACVGIAALPGQQGGLQCPYSAIGYYPLSGTYTAKLGVLQTSISGFFVPMASTTVTVP